MCFECWFWMDTLSALRKTCHDLSSDGVQVLVLASGRIQQFNPSFFSVC